MLTFPAAILTGRVSKSSTPSKSRITAVKREDDVNPPTSPSLGTPASDGLQTPLSDPTVEDDDLTLPLGSSFQDGFEQLDVGWMEEGYYDQGV